MYTILLVIHTILVIFLIGMVLLQRSEGDGMGGLGGGGNNQFMTGRATANFMTRTTAILAGLFMATSLILAIWASRMTNHSILDSVAAEKPAVTETVPAETAPAPVEPAAPVAPKAE